MDNQQGLTIQHMELCSMLYASLDGKGVWGRMDICVCIAESLCCSPGIITTLLIGYTPIQNKQVFFFLFLEKFFIFTLFYFTILYWFCHTLTRIRHRCTWVPNPEPLSHLPPHIISLDRPRAPAPSILYPVSNIDWRFVSYMIVYMFQCLLKF